MFQAILFGSYPQQSSWILRCSGLRKIEEILELSRIYSTEAPKSHEHSSCSYIIAEKFLKAICFDCNLV